MAEPRQQTTDRTPEQTPEQTPGGREVLIVAGIVVGATLGAAFITGALPTAGQDFVFRTPLAIIVILVGTVGLLVRLAHRPPVA